VRPRNREKLTPSLPKRVVERRGRLLMPLLPRKMPLTRRLRKRRRREMTTRSKVARRSKKRPLTRRIDRSSRGRTESSRKLSLMMR